MTYHTASAEEIKDGCPPGKSILWVTKEYRRFFGSETVILSGYIVYEDINEALADMAPKLLFFSGEYAFVNKKSEDGQSLDVWTLQYHNRRFKK